MTIVDDIVYYQGSIDSVAVTFTLDGNLCSDWEARRLL